MYTTTISLTMSLQLFEKYAIIKITRITVYNNMASLQARISRGRKYWYIVESRRVNGKPRPIPVAYLGKADDLLNRLQNRISENITCKSYSHGSIAALIRVIDDYNIIGIINKHVPYKKTNNKQMRNGLTVGASLALRAIEKICHPCSNMEFYSWAKTTSLEYLLHISCNKLDSQHFWDQMNALPVEALPAIEEEIVKQIIQKEGLSLDTLLLDATNFFTFIATDNQRCTLAQRGKNKQGRKNLRQIGVLLVVSRKDIIPLFHDTYIGNKPDSKLFLSVINKITGRVKALTSDLEDLTLVFDRGNNSKSNLSEDVLKIHYVGALSPSNHKDLVEKANEYYHDLESCNVQSYYRVRQELWGEDRTLLVYKSQELYNGQARGIETDIKKMFKNIEELNNRLINPRSKKLSRKEIDIKIKGIIKGKFTSEIIDYNIKYTRKDKVYSITYWVKGDTLDEIKRTRLGWRILMTNRHEWNNADIVYAYHGQSKVEYAFRNLKNPYHGSMRPQFHWTDQKIKIHIFTCVLGFLMESVIYRRAKLHGYDTTNYDNLFDRLDNIRLAALLEKTNTSTPNIVYQLEETEPEDELLIDALKIRDIHVKRPKISDVVVYN